MFIVFMSINVYAEEKGNGGIEYSECIPAGVDEYIRVNYTDLLSTVVQLDNYNGEALESYKLGLPFVIYNVGTYEQDEIYYYTVLDDSNTVRYIIDVIVTSDGYSIEISNEWVDVIKNIDNKYPVYVHGKKSGENVYHAVVFYGYMISGNTKYLVYWDPASHTSKSSLFQTSGTVFTNSNGAYTWKKSVSMS